MLARYAIILLSAVLAVARVVSENPLAALAPHSDCIDPAVAHTCVSCVFLFVSSWIAPILKPNIQVLQ